MTSRSRTIGWIVLAAITIGLLAVAAIDGRGVETQSDRIQRLNESFACPVCDGESVADSSAGVAANIRAFISDEVDAGSTDTEIRDKLVQAYTVEVLLNPPADGFAALVWILPVVALALGATLVGLYITRHTNAEIGEADIGGQPSASAAATSQHGGWSRAALVGIGLVAMAAVAGVGLARFSGERGLGDQITGSIDSSARSQSARCHQVATATASDGGGFLEAVICLDGVLEIEPDNAEALAYRGWYLLMASGQVSGAASNGDVGSEIEADLAAIADIAVESFSRSIQVAPNYPDPYVFRAVALDRQGDSDAVCADLEKLLSLDPPDFFLTQTARLIESNGCDNLN